MKVKEAKPNYVLSLQTESNGAVKVSKGSLIVFTTKAPIAPDVVVHEGRVSEIQLAPASTSRFVPRYKLILEPVLDTTRSSYTSAGSYVFTDEIIDLQAFENETEIKKGYEDMEEKNYGTQELRE